MNKKILTKFTYYVVLFFVFALVIYMSQIPAFRNFLSEIENKTFDLRQNITSKYKKPAGDIVIISVDDSSYEYIVNKFGSWPVPRDYWANIIEGLEPHNPKMIIFDILFTAKFNANPGSDMKLINAVRNNKNVYLSMNFDNYSKDIRKPPLLPSYLKNKVANAGIIKNNPSLVYTNCRPLMDELLNGTQNIGMINVTRDNDGIIRNMSPLYLYNGDYYKNLTLLAGMSYLGIESNSLVIDKENNLILDENHYIPLDSSGRAILNWYGPTGSYYYVSLWQVDKALKENNKAFLDAVFKNKAIYVGVTVNSLSDIKSTPVSFMYPGVEVHATFLNNIIDNSFIKKSSIYFDLSIALFMSLLMAFAISRFKSVTKTLTLLFGLITAYFIFSVFVMLHLNLWIGLVAPYVLSVAVFAGGYVIKYLIKSRDYEHTYKLAVTDGLTEMYNHRYFQEQMILNVENAKRYSGNFSLILIDIDFFKKFNDTYGHQSGDAVLRQVAQTIKRNIRSTDIPCRYGGEEMSVILSNTNKEDAITTAQKICEAVRTREFELANGSFTHVTISLGVACCPKDGETPQELIAYADKCLYIAKEHGRNQVVSDCAERENQV